VKIEYEATFTDVNVESIKKRLIDNGAKLVHKRFLQKRIVFHLPKGNEIDGGWVRVRQEAHGVTVSLKVISGDKIEDQKEVCIQTNSFDESATLLRSIGCREKAYQENYRELWRMGGVDVVIDEWPFLDPYIEIEGGSERLVIDVAKKLKLDYSQAIFGSVDNIYSRKYKISHATINDNTPRIVFGTKNPFV